MKYKIYLLAGVALLTVMVLLIFTGVVTEKSNAMFILKGLEPLYTSYDTLFLGIGLPLLLVIIYSRLKKKMRSKTKNKR